MKQVYTMLLLAFFATSYGQIVDFEEFDLEAESVFNGVEEDGGIQSQNIFLQNSFNPTYQSWSGFAISNKTDVTTPGFTNGYSAVAGSGAEGSEHYAVSFTLGSAKLNVTEGGINSISITNSTYAALSMQDGDQFAKKFGGEDGNDPDFFLLTIKGWQDGDMLVDSVNFYLADYRFEDNTQDYIVTDWQEVFLGQLSDTDSLQFSLSSSDNGTFGMNTPSYFCIDHIRQNIASSVLDVEVPFSIYPNPAGEMLIVETEQVVQAEIYNGTGILMTKKSISTNTTFDVENYESGVYYIRVSDGISSTTKRFIKI